MRRLRDEERRKSPAKTRAMIRLVRFLRCNVVALLALGISLAGTSYAAVILPADSVGSRQIRDDSLRAQDLSPAVRQQLAYRAAPSGTGAIRVLNGTHRNGAAREVGNRLMGLGYTIAGVGNAPTPSVNETLITFKAGARAFALEIAHVLGVTNVKAVPPNSSAPETSQQESVVVLLGADVAYRRRGGVGGTLSAVG